MVEERTLGQGSHPVLCNDKNMSSAALGGWPVPSPVPSLVVVGPGGSCLSLLPTSVPPSHPLAGAHSCPSRALGPRAQCPRQPRACPPLAPAPEAHLQGQVGAPPQDGRGWLLSLCPPVLHVAAQNAVLLGASVRVSVTHMRSLAHSLAQPGGVHASLAG